MQIESLSWQNFPPFLRLTPARACPKITFVPPQKAGNCDLLDQDDRERSSVSEIHREEGRPFLLTRGFRHSHFARAIDS